MKCPYMRTIKISRGSTYSVGFGSETRIVGLSPCDSECAFKGTEGNCLRVDKELGRI